MTLEDLHEIYEKDCRRFARSLARQADEAEDAVQEVMLRAQGHLVLLEILSPRERKSWLFTSIKNRILDYRRAEERERRVMAQFNPVVDPPLELGVDLQRRLEELPRTHREVVFRKYWLGMNSRLIGTELKLPASTVRHYLQQALGMLRKKMIQTW